MRRPRRLPTPPAEKPKKLQEVEAALEMIALEADIDAMTWKMRARSALPAGWDRIEAENPTRRRKAKMTLRLDEDVAIFFRWQGEGYQARINAILRLFMLSRLGVLPDEDLRKTAHAASRSL
jgi:uncharacterized protein (DUF4415 family)